MIDPRVAFLQARLDEDAADAEARRGVFPSPTVNDNGNVWLHVRPGGNAVVTTYLTPTAGYDDMAKLRSWAAAEEGWTKDRVLREVAAKRLMIDLVLRQHDRALDANDWMFDVDEWWTSMLLPYAEHPDFRPEWGP